MVGAAVGLVVGALVGGTVGAAVGHVSQANGHSSLTNEPLIVLTHSALRIVVLLGFLVIQAQSMVVVVPR